MMSGLAFWWIFALGAAGGWWARSLMWPDRPPRAARLLPPPSRPPLSHVRPVPAPLFDQDEVCP